MKKLISLSLVMVMLTGGLLLAENTKAEAMNNESAALLTASLILFGAPVINAIAHDHYRQAPVYGGGYYNSYPAETRVIYSAPQYERHYGRYQDRGNRYDGGWSEHRDYRNYRRDRDDSRGHYSGRHDRY